MIDEEEASELGQLDLEECRALRSSFAPLPFAIEGAAAALDRVAHALAQRQHEQEEGRQQEQEHQQRQEEEQEQQEEEEQQRQEEGQLQEEEGMGGDGDQIQDTPASTAVSDFERAAEDVSRCREQVCFFFEAGKERARSEEPGTVWTNATFALEAVENKTMGVLVVTEEGLRDKGRKEGVPGGEAQPGSGSGAGRAKRRAA